MIFFMRIAQNQHFHVTLLIFQAKNLCISALIRTFELSSKVLSFDNKNKKKHFCFVLCSLIRTFAPDHWHILQRRAGVTFVGK